MTQQIVGTSTHGDWSAKSFKVGVSVWPSILRVSFSLSAHTIVLRFFVLFHPLQRSTKKIGDNESASEVVPYNSQCVTLKIIAITSWTSIMKSVFFDRRNLLIGSVRRWSNPTHCVSPQVDFQKIDVRGFYIQYNFPWRLNSALGQHFVLGSGIIKSLGLEAVQLSF